MAMTVKTRRRTMRAGVVIGLVLGAIFAAAPVLWMRSSSCRRAC